MTAALAGVGTALLVGVFLAFTTGRDSWPGWIFELRVLDRLIQPARDSYATEGIPPHNTFLLTLAFWSLIFGFIYYRFLPRRREKI